MHLLPVITRSRPLLLASIAAGLLLAACASADETDDALDEEPTSDVGAAAAQTDDLLIVATTSILGDIVAELVAEDGTVEVLMPPGTDPHGFEPSAADAGMLREADLVVANGLDLEESLLSALEAAEQDGVHVLEVAPELDPIAFDFGGPDDHGHDDEHAADDGHGHGQDDGHGHEDDDGHVHGPEDPHVWHDPVRMADGVELIAAELAEIAEVVEPATWEARAASYVEQLLTVHEEIDGLLEDVAPANRILITNHDAFGYFAARYDFEVLGTVIPGSSTQVETNPQDFARLIETVEEAGVEVVFSENTESDRLAEQLASEVVGRSELDIEVVQLYSDALGQPGSGAESYLEMLAHNARLVADALA